MILSNSRSEDAKVRDYKIHEEKMVQLFTRIGLLFNVKSHPFKTESESQKVEASAETEFDVFGKAAAFIPKVDKDTVEIMIKVFSGEGVYQENNDILVLFRHFHTLKYK
jgi:hypothetical protein